MLKHRFRILHFPPEYAPDVQARIPAALCAIHNFIWQQDPSEGPLPTDNISSGYRHDDTVVESNNEVPDGRRDAIAERMWADYQRILAERGMLEDSDQGDFSEENVEDGYSTMWWRNLVYLRYKQI